ncbi:MAG: hypothetical protein QOI83_2736 [Streptomycetaceae bacterium]|nr:hypothetical protein [Streptomycetaceae bacterium]
MGGGAAAGCAGGVAGWAPTLAPNWLRCTRSCSPARDPSFSREKGRESGKAISAPAARLHGAADALRGPLPRTVPDQADQADLRTVEGAARAALGDAAYDTARAERRVLDPDAAHALLAGMKWGTDSVPVPHEGGDLQ